MKNINTIRKVFMVSVFVFVLGSCKDDFTAPDSLQGTPIADSVSANDNFNILTATLKTTGQYNSLNNNNSGVFTVFAPSDAAFITYFSAAYPAYFTPLAPVNEGHVLTFLSSLNAASTPTLAAFIVTTTPIMNYHIISSKLTSDLIIGNQVFATLQGARLSISKSGSSVMLNANSAVNGANVTALDLTASNGVVHTIDHVMAAIATANVLSPFGLTLNYAVSPTAITGGTTVGTANNFELMAVAIRKTGVTLPVSIGVTVLPNATPLPDFTIFSPTDAAWQTYLGIVVGTANEAAAQTAINAMDPTALSNILKYHIVSGRVLTTDLTNGQVVSTLLDGASFTVSISGPTITLNDKNAGFPDPVITTANNQTNSGIVHLIDAVLRSN